MHKKRSVRQQGFGAVEAIMIILVIALLAVGGWLLWQRNQDDKSSSTTATQNDEQSNANELQQTKVTSGKGAFSIMVPKGFPEIIRDTSSDLLIAMGTKQPEPDSGAEVKVKDMDGFGTDAPAVFSMSVSEATIQSIPQGEASDFSFGKTEEEVKGKKYQYEYPADTEVGIGTTRVKGDRDYVYVFPLKNGNVLRVFYAVYGVDHANHVATIDEIVRSTTLKQ